jgi:hypothetical protein
MIVACSCENRNRASSSEHVGPKENPNSISGTDDPVDAQAAKRLKVAESSDSDGGMTKANSGLRAAKASRYSKAALENVQESDTKAFPKTTTNINHGALVANKNALVHRWLFRTHITCLEKCGEHLIIGLSSGKVMVTQIS